jgi:hypothetical protein
MGLWPHKPWQSADLAAIVRAVAEWSDIPSLVERAQIAIVGSGKI